MHLNLIIKSSKKYNQSQQKLRDQNIAQRTKYDQKKYDEENSVSYHGTVCYLLMASYKH